MAMACLMEARGVLTATTMVAASLQGVDQQSYYDGPVLHFDQDVVKGRPVGDPASGYGS